MNRRPIAWGLGVALTLVGSETQPLARAQAPRPTKPTTAEPASPAPVAPTVMGGYWLSVDMVGPAAAQQGIAAELGEGLPLRDPAEMPPPGVLVGHIDDVRGALRWVGEHAFEPRPRLPRHPRQLQRKTAATPAGGLQQRHGATVLAFIVSGATPDLRARTISWPLDQSAVLPTGSTWLTAALVPERAPLFAAPAPEVPPAAEAHGMAHRRGGLFVLGWVDRCRPSATGVRCLRWAQVISRDGDRFSPGYLPNAQVALQTEWTRGDGALPRAQLVAVGVADGRAHWMLLARTRDNVLRRRTLMAPATDEGWPRASVRIEGDVAIVSLGDDPALPLALDARLDARKPG